MIVNYSKRPILNLILVALSLFISSCGISAGSAVAPNDARPNGAILVQGQFFGQSGQTVTGSALIFTVGAGSLVLRLEGLQTPEEVGLQVRLTGTPGGTIQTFA